MPKREFEVSKLKKAIVRCVRVRCVGGADKYKKNDRNLSGEVGYLTASGPMHVLIALVTPVPGSEVGKITGSRLRIVL